MQKKLTILFVPVDGVGHFNACIGVAQQLRDRGHNVIFAVQDVFKNKLKPFGFGEEWFSNSDEDLDNENQTIWGEIVAKTETALGLNAEEQLKELLHLFTKAGIKQVKLADEHLKEIVTRVKPDIIVVDLLSQQPALMDAGIPWIMSMSMNPLSISEKNVPPALTGYPTNGDRSAWKKYRNLRDSLFKPIFEEFNDWLVKEHGVSPLRKSTSFFIHYSPYANIYMYPEELDYTEFRPNPPNWHRFDTFVRSSDEIFEIPKELSDKPGKLVYFSIGTIGCSVVKLMKRLLAILAKSPHRFIISKGLYGDQLELSENMWGAISVPQTKVVPLVDLVITHGGNNTVTESFYFGKPLIVLPLWGDQLDNAQRLVEVGLGLRFHPYHVTEEELLHAIETMLNDNALAERMVGISKRIQSSNSQSRAADLVEKIARENPM